MHAQITTRPCIYCQGWGRVIDMDEDDGETFLVGCWSCQGTGYRADSLNQFHIALDQALVTIEDSIEGMAEATNARLDAMVREGERRQRFAMIAYRFMGPRSTRKPVIEITSAAWRPYPEQQRRWEEAVRRAGTSVHELGFSFDAGVQDIEAFNRLLDAHTWHHDYRPWTWQRRLWFAITRPFDELRFRLANRTTRRKD